MKTMKEQCQPELIMEYIVSICFYIIPGSLVTQVPDYHFTKGLTQNLNLRTYLKLEYNITSLNYIQQNLKFQAWFLLYWTISFTFFTCKWFKSY